MEKLVIISPLPPTKSGIADYVYEQIPYFKKKYKVICVVKGNKEIQEAVNLKDLVDVDLISAEEFEGSTYLHNAKLVYHLGNNIHHEHCIETYLKHPGIIVLHDYSLHHLITELTLAKGNFDRYKEILIESHGDIGGLIADKRNQGVYNELVPFLFPANNFVLKKAKGIIVHSFWSLMNIKVHTQGIPAVRIPMHYVDTNTEVDKLSKLEARQSLKLNSEDLIFSSIGFITPPKQVQLTLRALGKIKNQLPNFKFVLVGEPFDKNWLQNIIEENELKDNVIVTGFVSLDNMHKYIAASDFSISLRYPSAGETSATFMRSIGKGVTSIIFDYSSYSDYSNDVAKKIKLDTHDTYHLEEAIKDLAFNLEERERLSKNCRELVSTEHHIDNVINLYSKFVNDSYK